MSIKRVKHIISLCFGLIVSQQGIAQDDLGLLKEDDRIRGRHSIGLSVGHIDEWDEEFFSEFYTPNKGTSFNINYSYSLSSKWKINALLSF